MWSKVIDSLIMAIEYSHLLVNQEKSQRKLFEFYVTSSYFIFLFLLLFIFMLFRDKNTKYTLELPNFLKFSFIYIIIF